jgi:hypothetical protein
VEEEAREALKECNDDEERAILKLTELNFLQEVRKKIALDAEEEAKKNQPATSLLPKIVHIRRHQRTLNSPQKTAARQREMRPKLPKLRLDEALEKNNFEGWSAARIR